MPALDDGHHPRPALAGEGMLAGQQLPGEDAQGEHIAGGARRLALDLLGGGVAGAAHEGSRLSDPIPGGACRRLVGPGAFLGPAGVLLGPEGHQRGHPLGRDALARGAGVHQPGQPEVEHLHLELPAPGGLGHHDVPGRQVPVDQPLRVGRLQGVGHGADHLQLLAGAEVRRRLVQGAAFDELHGDVGAAGVLHPVVHLADIRVVQLRQGQGFPAEPLRCRGLTLLPRAQGLEGHAALQGGIPGLVDLAHAARTQQGLHPEAAHLRADIEDPPLGRGCGLGIDFIGHLSTGVFFTVSRGTRNGAS